MSLNGMSSHWQKLTILVLVAGLVTGCATAVPAVSPVASPSAVSPSPSLLPTAPSLTPSSAPSAPPIQPSPTAVPPSQTAIPTASPTPAAPPPTPAPSPPLTDGWIGPAEISGRGYHSLSLIVDGNGTAHAVGVLNHDVYYLSNASGAWTRERLTSAGRTRAAVTAYNNPSLAIDADGTLGVAYAGGMGDPASAFGPLPDTIYYTTNRGGSWSAPVVVADASRVLHPSLQLRDGRFHIAYQLGFPFDVLEPSERYPIRYATDDGGELTDVQVAEHGTGPILRLGPDGAPHLVFGDAHSLLPDQTELRYATAPAGTDNFTVESIAGSREVSPVNPKVDEAVLYGMEVAADGEAIVTWAEASSSDPSVHVHRRQGGSWSDTVLDVAALGLGGQPRPLATTVDAAGDAHMIVITANLDSSETWVNQAVYYVTNRDGSLRADRLTPEHAWEGSITLDGHDRPHLLFGVPAGSVGDPSLWYGIAPAN